MGLVTRNGILTLDYGQVRVEQAGAPTLPLGFDGVSAPAAPSSTAEAQTQMLLAQLLLQNQSLKALFSVTIKGNSTATNGYAWYLDANTNWQNVPFSTGGIFGPLGSAITGTPNDVFDWAPWPLGGTASSATNPGLIVFTNYLDEVYAWDPGQGGSLPGNYGSLFGTKIGGGGGASFHAKTVELFDDRLVFLNTKEDASIKSYPRRFRYTTVGSSIPDPTGVGSGFIEYDELNGQGLRILKMGDLVACYFEDGVAFARRTFIADRPFTKQYVTKERGLIATNAVTKITDDVHFGIFTDGWYFFSSDGAWKEVGISSNNQGHRSNRWLEKFYSSLDASNRHKLNISFDPLARVVRVAFPLARLSSDPDFGKVDQVWVYDLRTDTVWPDETYEVTCWGKVDRQLSSGGTWGTIGGTWASLSGQSWASFAPTYALEQVVHGNSSGLVFGHDRTVFTRDGNVVTWNYKTFKHDLGDYRTRKIVDEVRVQYETQGVSNLMSVQAENEVGTVAGQSIDFLNGGGGRIDQDYVNMRLSGTHLGLNLSGSGPIKLHAAELRLVPLGIIAKRQS